ncbi:hypothetical protein Ciccas_012127 [Cichlidogyrus casuarinus]|uniref:Uncharacterized protein n=1 Tax=Cichlidogyrus casuarinus TaxID=1844966 RepID=A0ABD2PRK1_9PLAT
MRCENIIFSEFSWVFSSFEEFPPGSKVEGVIPPQTPLLLRPCSPHSGRQASVEQVLARLESSCTRNQLPVSTSKCGYVTYGNSSTGSLELFGGSLSLLDSTRDIGLLTVNNSISLAKHTECAVGRANTYFKSLRSTKAKIACFKCIILPQLLVHICTYVPSCRSFLLKLEGVQR